MPISLNGYGTTKKFFRLLWEDLKKKHMLKKVKEIFTNTGPKILQNDKISSKIFENNLNQLSYKSFGNLNRNKVFYVIRRYPTADFFSNITFILNHLKICDRMNFIPIIDMRYYPTLYNELNKIKKKKNAWEYFFKKINNYSLKEVYKSKNVFLSALRFEKNMSLDMTNNSLLKYFKKIKVRESIIKKRELIPLIIINYTLSKIESICSVIKQRVH